VRVKDGLRAMGILRVRRLGWPVVSVGSLSAGGAGKTPVVIALAAMLKERGWTMDVLSRGYGREGMGVEQVDPDAEDAAGRFGDEPVLIARAAGVPVWVGAERFAAGLAAEAATGGGEEADSSAALRNDKVKGVHLLDDGFQHRRLARAMDVVLVTAEDLEDAPLPAGNLREGLGALRRADAVVVREEEGGVESRLSGLLRPDAVVWKVRRELRLPEPLGVLSAGRRPVAFCGIARPEGFAAMLAEAGCGAVQMIEFGDHHAYSMVDMERIIAVAQAHGATGFWTTEKDAVKLFDARSADLLERLRAVGPVCVAKLGTKFLDEATVLRALEARLS
jgi:tetraacyldisaccharide 4'-kinase